MSEIARHIPELMARKMDLRKVNHILPARCPEAEKIAKMKIQGVRISERHMLWEQLSHSSDTLELFHYIIPHLLKVRRDTLTLLELRPDNLLRDLALRRTLQEIAGVTDDELKREGGNILIQGFDMTLVDVALSLPFVHELLDRRKEEASPLAEEAVREGGTDGDTLDEILAYYVTGEILNEKWYGFH